MKATLILYIPLMTAIGCAVITDVAADHGYTFTAIVFGVLAALTFLGGIIRCAEANKKDKQ